MPFTPLSRTGWTATATASEGSHPPSLAIDGDLGTYWWTGAGTPQSISIDCGTAQTFNCVGLQPSTGVSGDRPRNCQVYVSDDGISWGSAVGTGTDLANDTTAKYIDFPAGAVTKRYFRVTVTLSNTGGWSQIGDLNAGTLTPTTAIRQTQEVLETAELPAPDIRETQIVLEVAKEPPATPEIRETQVGFEHIGFPPNESWLTQACLEYIGPPSARQMGGVRNFAYTGVWAHTPVTGGILIGPNDLNMTQVCLEIVIPAADWPV